MLPACRLVSRQAGSLSLRKISVSCEEAQTGFGERFPSWTSEGYAVSQLSYPDSHRHNARHFFSEWRSGFCSINNLPVSCYVSAYPLIPPNVRGAGGLADPSGTRCSRTYTEQVFIMSQD